MRVTVAVRVAVPVCVIVGVCVGVRVCEGVRVTVRVAVSVAVLVAVPVAEGVRVAVRVRVNVAVGDAVGVHVKVALGEGLRVLVAVRVGVSVRVGVGGSVGVCVGMGVRVREGEAVRDGVDDGVSVAVKVGEAVPLGLRVGERVRVCVRLGIGDEDAVALGVPVALGRVSVGEGVLVAVKVNAGVADTVGEAVGAADAVNVALPVAVFRGVGVGLLVELGVGLSVGLSIGLSVGDGRGDAVGLGVSDGVGERCDVGLNRSKARPVRSALEIAPSLFVSAAMQETSEANSACRMASRSASVMRPSQSASPKGKPASPSGCAFARGAARSARHTTTGTTTLLASTKTAAMGGVPAYTDLPRCATQKLRSFGSSAAEAKFRDQIRSLECVQHRGGKNEATRAIRVAPILTREVFSRCVVNQAMAAHASTRAVCRIAVAVLFTARVVAAKSEFVADVVHHSSCGARGKGKRLAETAGHRLVSAWKRLLEREFHRKPLEPEDGSEHRRAGAAVFAERAHGQGTIADSRVNGSTAALPIGGFRRGVTVGVVPAGRASFALRAGCLSAASSRCGFAGALLVAAASFAHATRGAVTAKAAAPVSRTGSGVTVTIPAAQLTDCAAGTNLGSSFDLPAHRAATGGQAVG